MMEHLLCYLLFHNPTGKRSINGLGGDVIKDWKADFEPTFLSACEVWKPYTLCMQNHFILISDQDLALLVQ